MVVEVIIHWVLLLLLLTKFVGGITQIFMIKANASMKTDDKSTRYYCRYWTDVSNHFFSCWELTTAAVYGVHIIDPRSSLRFLKNLNLTCERVNERWTNLLTVSNFIIEKIYSEQFYKMVICMFRYVTIRLLMFECTLYTRIPKQETLSSSTYSIFS